MNEHKFDVKKLEKLNNIKRLEMINLSKVIEELNLEREEILVDIGVGTGFFSEEFLNRIDNSLCYGLDISKEMLKWTEENRASHLKGRLKLKLMKENEIPLEDNFADFMFMIAVYHELDNSKELLKDMYRVLKDGKKVLISDWKEGMHHHFVSLDKIKSDLEDVGFKNIKIVDESERLISLSAEK